MAQFTDYNYGEHFGQIKKRIFFGEELRWKPDTPRVIVEIGSREGSSALWFLSNLLLADASRIYCVDPWEESPKYLENFKANIREHPAHKKVTVVRSRSFEALQKMLGQGFKCDLVYVDGSHTAHDVLWDLMLSFKILKIGGVMMCDDYTWPFKQGRILDTPKVAIDAFTTIFAEKIRWVRAAALFQVTFRKIAD